MKHIIASTVFGLTFMLCANSNVLNNPSFEQLTPDGIQPDVWTMVKKPGKNGTHYSDKNFFYDGRRSLKMEQTGAESQILCLQNNLGAGFSALPAGKMEFSVYAYTKQDNTSVRIYFESGSAKATFLKIFKLKPNEWQKITVPFEKDARDFSRAYVVLQLWSPGTVWFDRAYLGPFQK